MVLFAALVIGLSGADYGRRTTPPRYSDCRVLRFPDRIYTRLVRTCTMARHSLHSNVVVGRVIRVRVGPPAIASRLHRERWSSYTVVAE
jgi:hypothetical protein